MGIKHLKVSSVPDSSNTDMVRPLDWNANHIIDGDVDFNGFSLVNADLEGLVGAFNDLSDVPNSYAGSAGKVPTVNAGETGLEFTTAVAGGDTVLTDWVTPQQYGAVADGTSHPLSEFYGSLAAAQAAYNGAFYFITSLTQQIDYAASKAAANECFGGDLDYDVADFAVNGAIGTSSGTTVGIPGGAFAVNELVGRTLFGQFQSNLFVVSSPIISNTANTITTAAALSLTAFDSRWLVAQGEHGNLSYLNKVLYFPAGTYMFANDTLLIRNLRSGRIVGAGKLNSVLKANDIVMAFDGCWYTTFSNMMFQLNTVGTTAFDLDGNVPGHPYTTRAVQSVTFIDCFFEGGNSTYAFAMCRQGGSGAQGSECMFIDCHFQNATFSCYYQSGFNALANTIMGGNFQNYPKHGIYCNGSISVFNTGFQSTRYYEQQINTGYDIYLGDFGAYEGCSIYGCRTEGVRFCFTGAVTPDIRAVIGVPAMQTWSASTGYGTAIAGREIIEIFINVDNYRSAVAIATTTGVSGLTEPVWPDSGTIVDGTVEWTVYDVSFINISQASGSVDRNSVSCVFFPIIAPNPPLRHWRNVGSDDRFRGTDDFLFVNTLDNAVDIRASEVDNTAAGRVCTLYRYKGNNTLRFLSGIGSNEFGNTALTMPLGERGYRSYVHGQGNEGAGLDGAERWCLINTRFLQDMFAPTPSAIGAETVTGYITIWDSEAGAPIKLAVVS